MSVVLAFVPMAEKGGSADEQKPLIDMSSLADALPGGKASAHSGLVNALKDKLQTLVGTSSGYIESLPPKIKKRVETLQKMQAEHDELLAKFLVEKAALEAKYQNMYGPLYSKRHDIVNGITDIEDNKEEKTAQASKEDNIEEKGVPEFWRTAMTNNEILRAQITERDEDALKFLKDIKWSRLDDDEKGFKLDFFFNENHYFKNTVLTKIYYMVDENEPILERVTGTEIDWFPGKKLTEKVMRKKLKKGAKSGKTVTRVEQCASFFNFFKPPQIPDDDEDLDDDLADDLQDLLEQDYDIGSTIRDKIIPRAVSWYTGEAVETDDEDDEEDDEEDEDEDDDEEEDEDEEDKEDDEEEDDHEDKDHVNLKRVFKAKPKISIHRATN